MFKKLVVNATEPETRVALIEEGTIVELYINRKNSSDIAGNIYKGRVQRVLPGMQAAFVDIGLNQAAFIHVDDIVEDRDRETEFGFENGSGSEQIDVSATVRARKPTIEELIGEGQEIIVHVAKSPIGTKGARITTRVSLPGRFLVLMPFSDHVGVSRKIENEEERNRLKNIVIAQRENEYGYIVRTASEGIGSEKLSAEMRFLGNLWESIQVKALNRSAPTLLHKELDVSLRVVRDLLTHEVEKLVIDSREGYEAVLTFLDSFMPSLKGSVELYEGADPIFDAFNIEVDIARALKKKVWLKSGGYVVIERTEALVAIDVNTGRYVGKHNLEETIVKTNLEAVKEIAYQIRLRDIGGIIIIDFIDMEKKSNQEKVFNTLLEALQKDRSKTHILPISEMGLIQMTRKRIRQSLNDTLCEPCIYCEGEGRLISRRSICQNIYRHVQRDARDMVGVRFTLHVHPEIAELLHGEENHILVSLESAIGKQIVIYPNPRYDLEGYDIFEILKE